MCRKQKKAVLSLGSGKDLTNCCLSNDETEDGLSDTVRTQMEQMTKIGVHYIQLTAMGNWDLYLKLRPQRLAQDALKKNLSFV